MIESEPPIQKYSSGYSKAIYTVFCVGFLGVGIARIFLAEDWRDVAINAPICMIFAIILVRVARMGVTITDDPEILNYRGLISTHSWPISEIRSVELSGTNGVHNPIIVTADGVSHKLYALASSEAVAGDSVTTFVRALQDRGIQVASLPPSK